MKSKNNVDIIFEDNDLIVINKPAGILSIPDRYDKSSPNAFNILKKHYSKIFTVHRLDKFTSGVMVFAKNQVSHKHLNTQFENNKVNKIYHIVVQGIIRENDLEIDIPIDSHPFKKGVSMPSARGKESLTKLKVLERFQKSTLCEVQLITGRHHQIRVHCATIGHPLLIDEIYGNSQEFYLSSIKRRYNIKKDEIEKPIISRLTMHSYKLEFIHPTSNNKVSFKAEYPKDFATLIKVLSKYSNIKEFNTYNF